MLNLAKMLNLSKMLNLFATRSLSLVQSTARGAVVLSVAPARLTRL